MYAAAGCLENYGHDNFYSTKIIELCGSLHIRDAGSLVPPKITEVLEKFKALTAEVEHP